MTTFVVETGSGSATANSYGTVAAATAYWADHGAPTTWSGASQPQQEQALRLATQYIDVTYGPLWRGVQKTRDQALDWPRWAVVDDNNYSRDTTTIPVEIQQACFEMALRSLQGDELLPDIDKPGDLQSKTETLGPLSRSQTFVGGQSQVKRYRLVDLLLAPLTQTGTEKVLG